MDIRKEITAIFATIGLVSVCTLLFFMAIRTSQSYFMTKNESIIKGEVIEIEKRFYQCQQRP